MAQNFKSYSEISFEFGKVNKIFGANGTGKTSLIQAIFICLYGTTNESITKEKFIKDGAESANIIADVEGIGTIARIIYRDDTSPSLIVNSIKMSQSQFEKKYNLPDVKYFFSSINPSYWSNLDYKTKRQIMQDLSPLLNPLEIFKEIYGEKYAKSYSLTTYEGINKLITETNNTIQQINGRVLQLNTPIVLEEQIPIDTKKHSEYSAKYLKNEDLKRYIESLNKQFDVYKNWDSKLKNEQRLKEIQEIVTTYISNYPKLEKLDNENVKIAEYLDNINSINLEINKQNVEIALIDKEIDQFNKLIKSGVCPTCKQKVVIADNSYIPGLQFKRNVLNKQLLEFTEKQTELKELTKMWNEYKNELASYRGEYANIQKTLDSFKDLAQEQYDELKTKLDNTTKEMQELNWTEDDMQQWQKIEDEIKHNKILLEMGKKTNDANQLEIKRLNLELEELSERMHEYKILQEAHGPKGITAEIAKRTASYMESKVAKYATNVKIETIEALKTDPSKFREVFNVFKNDIQEIKLSTGQQMTLNSAFCLTIQDMMYEKLGCRTGMLFIDNASLITNIENIVKVANTLQIFYAVNTTDTELHLKVDAR